MVRPLEGEVARIASLGSRRVVSLAVLAATEVDLQIVVLGEGLVAVVAMPLLGVFAPLVPRLGMLRGTLWVLLLPCRDLLIETLSVALRVDCLLSRTLPSLSSIVLCVVRCSISGLPSLTVLALETITPLTYLFANSGRLLFGHVDL